MRPSSFPQSWSGEKYNTQAIPLSTSGAIEVSSYEDPIQRAKRLDRYASQMRENRDRRNEPLDPETHEKYLKALKQRKAEAEEAQRKSKEWERQRSLEKRATTIGAKIKRALGIQAGNNNSPEETNNTHSEAKAFSQETTSGETQSTPLKEGKDESGTNSLWERLFLDTGIFSRNSILKEAQEAAIKMAQKNLSLFQEQSRNSGNEKNAKLYGFLNGIIDRKIKNAPDLIPEDSFHILFELSETNSFAKELYTLFDALCKLQKRIDMAKWEANEDIPRYISNKERDLESKHKEGIFKIKHLKNSIQILHEKGKNKIEYLKRELKKMRNERGDLTRKLTHLIFEQFSQETNPLSLEFFQEVTSVEKEPALNEFLDMEGFPEIEELPPYFETAIDFYGETSIPPEVIDFSRKSLGEALETPEPSLEEGDFHLDFSEEDYVPPLENKTPQISNDSKVLANFHVSVGKPTPFVLKTPPHTSAAQDETIGIPLDETVTLSEMGYTPKEKARAM